MMTTIDRAACRLLRDEMDSVLSAVAAKHGLTYKGGSCRFDPAGGAATFSCEFMLPQIGGVDREQVEFERHAAMFSCRANDYKARFTSRGITYELVGFEPRRSRFPYRGRSTLDGKVVLFTETIMRQIRSAPLVVSAPLEMGSP